MLRSEDTSERAHERQLAALRAMTPEDRLRLADEMSSEVRTLARAGIRARHPEYTPEQVDAAEARSPLGDATR